MRKTNRQPAERVTKAMTERPTKSNKRKLSKRKKVPGYYLWPSAFATGIPPPKSSSESCEDWGRSGFRATTLLLNCDYNRHSRTHGADAFVLRFKKKNYHSMAASTRGTKADGFG